MKSTTLTKLKKAWRVTKWLGVAGIAYYLVLAEGWKDLVFGRFHRKAQTMFSDVRGVTEARIYLLMGTEKQKESATATFPIRPYHQDDPVCGEVRLMGDQLTAFLESWNWQRPAFGQGAGCHEPAYGFRLYRGPFLIKETSICWGCSNFYVSIAPFVAGLYGFDANSKQGQHLLNFCDKLLPYARDEKVPEKKL